jgi:hypothetical protein
LAAAFKPQILLIRCPPKVNLRRRLACQVYRWRVFRSESPSGPTLIEASDQITHPADGEFLSLIQGLVVREALDELFKFVHGK